MIWEVGIISNILISFEKILLKTLIEFKITVMHISTYMI
jgi:hypothetical protein